MAKKSVEAVRDEWCAEYVKARNKVERLRLALLDAQEVCQSAYQIAQRGGKETNWQAFTKRVAKTLDRQKAALMGSLRDGR